MPALRLTLAAVLLGALTGCETAGVAAERLEQPAFWQRGAGSAADRFELAKRSTPELISFVRRMPKGADLHNHLGGATYAQFLMRSARDAGRLYDTQADRFVTEAGEHTVTFEEFVTNPVLVSAFRDAVSIRGWMGEGGNGHDAFFKSFRHLTGTGRTVPDMLAEVIARNHYQNVMHLELMVTVAPDEVLPRFLQASGGLDIADLPASLAPYRPLFGDADVKRAFTQQLDRWERAAAVILEREHGLSWDDAPTVRYVPQLDRVGSLDRFFGAAVLFMSGIAADPRIAALNIVAPEDLPTSRWQFDAHMSILDYLWRELGEPPITLHAGELSLRESPVEPMQDRIRRSIVEGHARRIGHGVSVAWERDVIGLLEYMRDYGVLVEVIPTSAEVILGKSGIDHPFYLYRSAGVPMCISTDDEGVSRSNLTMEYVKMVRAYDLSYRELLGMSRNCLHYAFMDPDTRAGRLEAFDTAVARFEESLTTGYRE